MITYKSHKFNNLTEKIKEILLNNNINTNDFEPNLPNSVINEIQLYVSSLLASHNEFLSTTCPKCGKPHLEPFLSNYQRNIIFRIGNVLVNIKLLIPRVKCSNCHSTHALLPDFCVPLKQYSNQAIISIATEAIQTSTDVVAENLNIDSKQVRRIVKSNKNHILLIYHKYLEFFKLKSSLILFFVDIISNIPKNFNELFFLEFKFIFLYDIKIKRKLYMQYSKLSI